MADAPKGVGRGELIKQVLERKRQNEAAAKLQAAATVQDSPKSPPAVGADPQAESCTNVGIRRPAGVACTTTSDDRSGSGRALGRAALIEKIRQLKVGREDPKPSPEPVKPETVGEPEKPKVFTEDDVTVVKKGEKGRKFQATANVVRISYKDKDQGVWEYAVDFQPPLDARRDTIFVMEQFTDVIGPVKTFDGAFLNLPMALPEYITKLTGHAKSGEKIDVTITLKKRKALKESIQLFNVLFRRVKDSLKLVEIKRSHFNPQERMMVPQHKLEVWPGYVTSIQELEGGLMLTCDVSHKVLRMDTAYSVLKDASSAQPNSAKNSAEKALIGSIVMTKYNYRTYRIDGIDFDKSPKSTFLWKATNEEISYMEYYKRIHNIAIKDPNQPLLVNRVKKTQLEDKDRTVEICLIPELCSMTGLTDAMRSDFRVMKDVAVHTRLTPDQRQQALVTFLKNVQECPEARRHLDNWNLTLDSKPIVLEARQLQPETLHVGRGKEIKVGPRVDWGRDLCFNHCLTTVPITKWHCVFVDRNKAVSEGFIKLFQQLAPKMGIQVSPPSVGILQNDRPDTYVNHLQKTINKDLQLVVVIMPSARDDRYNCVKRICCVDRPIPSQVINANTVSNQKKVESVVQKIALQINCKLAGELWGAVVPKKRMMIVGIDVYHDPTRTTKSVAGVVCSMNATYSRWHSKAVSQSPGQELIDALKVGFGAGMKAYYAINNFYPEQIIVYRDGVSESQLDLMASYEAQQFKDFFKLLKDDYSPQFAFIVVQKRINYKFFQLENSRLENPAPGSVLDHSIGLKKWYDFLLISQRVTQGTACPTHYIVVCDDTGFSVDIMQKLSFKMTHMYFNWPGTVRVPAPCQYAHKLAYQVGENIRARPSELLEDRLFYL